MIGNILIIDDEASIRLSLEGILSDEGYESVCAASGEEGLSILDEAGPDLVLLDIWLPGMDGLQVLEEIKKRKPGLPVIMISGHGNVETAVKSTRLGAYDFIEKPLDMDKILLAARNALQQTRLSEELDHLRSKAEPPRLTGDSPAIEQVRNQIERVAPTDAWVLITGENGTGKELAAHAIHRQSLRAGHAFVDVNCAAIPEELIESELFGHEKGAFTGAGARRRGRFDLANGGTLFLDEIADMSLKTQAKILRILQEQRFERVGGTKTIQVNVRVLAATNKDLQEEIAENRFREDLFHRLNVIPIHLPPLRERPEDIATLAQDFLRGMAQKSHAKEKQLTPEALDMLKNQAWSGNVRELKNLMERAVILCPKDEIGLRDIEPFLPGAGKEIDLPGDLFQADYKQARSDFERIYLQKRLESCQGNISKCADEVGLERSHLSKKLKALGLT